MAILTRQQLLDLESEELGKLVNNVPGDIQDDIMALMAGLTNAVEIDIPDIYIQGVIDGLQVQAGRLERLCAPVM